MQLNGKTPFTYSIRIPTKLQMRPTRNFVEHFINCTGYQSVSIFMRKMAKNSTEISK